MLDKGVALGAEAVQGPAAVPLEVPSEGAVLVDDGCDLCRRGRVFEKSVQRRGEVLGRVVAAVPADACAHELAAPVEEEAPRVRESAPIKDAKVGHLAPPPSFLVALLTGCGFLAVEPFARLRNPARAESVVDDVPPEGRLREGEGPHGVGVFLVAAGRGV